MNFIDEYHKLYEGERIWEKNTWLGEPCYKWPPDAFVIQELIWKLEPDFIIETGTGCGGSALFYASIFELMGHGQVITCDIERKHVLENHPLRNVTKRIKFIYGGSTNLITLEQIEKTIGDTTDNIVLLDSYHTKEHVLKEMEYYEKFVGEHYHMIVEDSHAGKVGHPITWEWDNDGPYEAVQDFLKTHDDFKIDYSCEKHLLTFNPSGFLVRKRIK